MITESVRTGDYVVIVFEPGTASRREAATHVRTYCVVYTVGRGHVRAWTARFLHQFGDTLTYRLTRKTSP